MHIGIVNYRWSTILGVGTWGQLGAVALAGLLLLTGLDDLFLVACILYLLATLAGITAIARLESTVAGPLVYPFLLPGLLPLYYFAVRTHETETADEPATGK